MLLDGEIVVDYAYYTQCLALQEEKRLQTEKLLELSKQVVEVKLKAVKERWGVYVGCVVKESNSGKLFTVSHIRVRASDPFEHDMRFKPWIEGYPMKKDGKYSTVKRNIYGDWEVIVG